MTKELSFKSITTDQYNELNLNYRIIDSNNHLYILTTERNFYTCVNILTSINHAIKRFTGILQDIEYNDYVVLKNRNNVMVLPSHIKAVGTNDNVQVKLIDKNKFRHDDFKDYN